jgi:hypothetical protein
MRLLVLVAVTATLASSSFFEAAAADVHRAHHRHSTVRNANSTYSESHIQQLPDSARVPANPLPVKADDASGNAAHTSPTTCNAQNASSPACYAATQQAHPVGR